MGVGSLGCYSKSISKNVKWMDCYVQQKVDGMYAAFGTACSDKRLCCCFVFERVHHLLRLAALCHLVPVTSFICSPVCQVSDTIFPSPLQIFGANDVLCTRIYVREWSAAELGWLAGSETQWDSVRHAHNANKTSHFCNVTLCFFPSATITI